MPDRPTSLLHHSLHQQPLYHFFRFIQPRRQRQGMHEVLAPLVLALEKEAAAAARSDTTTTTSSNRPATSGGGGATESRTSSSWLGTSMVNGAPMDAATHPGAAAILGRGSTPQDLEADAFWLFSAVMEGLEGFYEHGTNNASSSRTPGGAGRGKGRGGGGGRGRGGGDEAGVDSPVVEMCKRLQGPRLREADPVLQEHLADLDISPQVKGSFVVVGRGLNVVCRMGRPRDSFVLGPRTSTVRTGEVVSVFLYVPGEGGVASLVGFGGLCISGMSRGRSRRQHHPAPTRSCVVCRVSFVACCPVRAFARFVSFRRAVPCERSCTA